MKKTAPIAFEKEIIDELKFTLARDSVTASRREWWIATSMAIQRIIISRMMKTLAVHNEGNVRRIKLSDQDGDFAVELPMTMGVIAGGAIVLAAPWLAILGVVAGMITKVKIVVERGAANAPAEEAAKPVDPPVD